MTGVMYIYIYDVLRVCSTHSRYAVHHVRHALVAKVQLLYAREEMLAAARGFILETWSQWQIFVPIKSKNTPSGPGAGLFYS
jgi:hypothetical protein